MPRGYYDDPRTAELYKELGDVRHEKIAEIAEEDVREIIGLKIEIDPIVEKIIGKENAEQIKIYLDDQEVKDLEFMALSGRLATNEMMDYAFLVPQIQQIFQLVDQLAVEIGKHIRKNSLSYTLNRKVFNDRKVDARKISEFYDSFRDTCIQGIHIPEKRPIQIVLYNYMIKCLYREIGNAIIDDIEKTPNGVDKIMGDYLRRGIVDKPDPTAEGIMQTFLIKRGKLGQTLQARLSKEKHSKEEIAKLVQEVNELSVQQNAGHSETLDGITVTIDPFDETTLKDYFLRRPTFLCQGSIAVPELSSASINNFVFYIYRFTGELVLSTNIGAAKVVGERGADNLKTVILKILEKYLRSSIPEIAKETAILLEPQVESIVVEKFVYKKPDQEVSVGESESVVEVPEKGKGVSLSDLKGIRGSRIKQALLNLLGEPLRISGSHHVFRCRDGKTYPISLHDSETVGTGLLSKCLKHFGLSPLELKEQLV